MIGTEGEEFLFLMLYLYQSWHFLFFLSDTGTSSSEEDSVVHVNLPSGDSPLSDTLVSLDLLWHLFLIKVNLFYFSQSFVCMQVWDIPNVPKVSTTRIDNSLQG